MPKKTPPTKKTTGAEPLLSGPKMAEQVLADAGRPMHGKLICEVVLAIDAARPPASRAFRGKTPAATILAKLAMGHKNDGAFVRTAPGVYALRSWPKRTLALKPVLPGDAPAKVEPAEVAPVAVAAPRKPRKPAAVAEPSAAPVGEVVHIHVAA